MAQEKFERAGRVAVGMLDDLGAASVGGVASGSCRKLDDTGGHTVQQGWCHPEGGNAAVGCMMHVDYCLVAKVPDGNLTGTDLNRLIPIRH